MAKKIGLPESIKLKHDHHLVDELSSRSRTCVIRYISLERIVAGAQQPRSDFGDIEALAASIREKGVIEPIILRSRDGRFEIIAGERRYRAARLAGLTEIPGIEYDIQDNEALELSIVENAQRKDLNPFELAFSLKSLNEIYGYTHEEIAKKVGNSRVSITEMIRLSDMPPQVVSRCQEMGIESKSFLLELVKLENIEQMMHVLDQYAKSPFSRDAVKEIRRRKTPEGKEKGRPAAAKAQSFKFVAPDKSLKIDFRFREGEINRERLIDVLQTLLEDLQSGRIKGINT
ncbi:MAG TPA: ParB/RepB/Spo0J family partition protein [Candidatus Aminicenantes bacterium]|nr:ParB/RepB/Spo0J family partition protein [Candidatus Aminicenantes bacterium]